MKTSPKNECKKIDMSKMYPSVSAGVWEFVQEKDGTYTVHHKLSEGSEKIGKVYLDDLNFRAEVSFNLGVRLNWDDLHTIDVLLVELDENLKAQK